MIASFSQYLHKLALLDSGDLSPEVRAKVQAACDEFKAKNLADGTDNLPLKPEDGASLINEAKGLPSQEEVASQLPQEPSHAASQAPGRSLVSLLDPMSPLVPQALAVQPATTHPEGDKAAEDEWVRGDLSNPAGRVIVYDTPVSEIRRDLAGNPALVQMLNISPDSVMSIKKGDSVEQRYNDWKWRETADAAAKGGKTAYRYSKASYLGDGKGAGLLDSLSTKLKAAVLPGIEKATAFVMGVDDTALLGAGNAASDAGLLDDGPLPPKEQAARAALETRKHAVKGSQFLGGGNDEVVGGTASHAPGASARDTNDSLREEHPTLRTAGQVVGAFPGAVEGAVKAGARGVEKAVAKGAETRAGNAVRRGIEGLSEWSPANGLWDTIMGKPATTATGMAGAVLKSAGAGVISQGVTEGARAGANYAATGDTGTTLSEAGGRMVDAGEGAAVFGAIHAAAKGIGGKVRGHDGWYKGLPGDVEKLNGGKVYPLVGHVTPKAVIEARAAARAREMPVTPTDVFAENLAKPLADAGKANEAGIRKHVGETNSRFQATPEGRAPLPASELAGSAYEKWKQRNASIRGALPTPVGAPNADRPVKGIFNANIEGISVKPVEGWIPMPVSHAQALLSPSMRLRGVRAAREPGRAVMRADAGPRAAAEAERAVGETSAALDHRGYRANPVKRLPSGEQTGLAKVDPNRGPGNARPRELGTSGTRYQDQGPQHEPFLDPKYPGAPHPELGASDTRFQGEPRYDIEPNRAAGSVARGSRAATAGERAGATGARTHEVGPRGEPSPGPKAPGIRAEPVAEREPADIPDADFTQKRARFKPKGAPNRTTRAQPATAEGKARQNAADPKTFLTEMRKRGIKTVYVAPRRYNAMHQESAIRQVRRKGGENINDRDLEDLYHAALRDRDARPLEGKPGGWSELQQTHQRGIREAKATRKRAGKDEDAAYNAVIGAATPKVGQSRDLRALSETARLAGGNALEQLRGARVMAPLTELQRTSGFGKAAGRMRYGPSAAADFAVLRGLYPVTRSLENVNLGKASLIRRDAKEEKKRRHDRDVEHRAEAGGPPTTEKHESAGHRPRRKIERKAQ